MYKTLGRGPTLSIFTLFSTVSLPYAILTHVFVIFTPEHHRILLFIFILALKTSFIIISIWIKNVMSSPFFCSHHPLMLVGEVLIRWWNGTTFLSLKWGLHLRNGLRAHHWPSSREVRERYFSVMPYREVVGYYLHLSYCWAGDDGDSLWLLSRDQP